MHIVVLHDWQDVTQDLAEKCAAALSVTVFDARQRLAGKGPAVVASLADQRQAQRLVETFRQGGFKAFFVDVAASRAGRKSHEVRQFELGEELFCCIDTAGNQGKVAYGDVRLLLPASRIVTQAATGVVTERKFSMGKTLLAGGLPMTKKVQRREAVATEERERVLFICTQRAWFLCAQESLDYGGLGHQKQLTRDLNFNLLLSELRQRCRQAAWDDRLLRRADQVKLLGPLLPPDGHLDLAVEILARAVAEMAGEAISTQ